MIIFEVNERYDIETDFYYYRAEAHLLEVMNALVEKLTQMMLLSMTVKSIKMKEKEIAKDFVKRFNLKKKILKNIVRSKLLLIFMIISMMGNIYLLILRRYLMTMTLVA